jgi:thioredoxin reductase (NADPH)
MSQYLIDQLAAIQNVSVLTNTHVMAVAGNGHLESITIACDAPGGRSERTLAAESVFIFIGAVPRTDWLGDGIARDEFGFIYTGPDIPRDNGKIPGWRLDRDPFLLETNVAGIFCAGDVRHQSVKRVASAVGEGSIAVQFTHRYLAET